MGYDGGVNTLARTPDAPWPRWLDRKTCAAYICVKPGSIAGLVRRGLLPKPTDHLGPRMLRWDREAVDTLLLGRGREADVDAAFHALAARIASRGLLKRGRVA